jgi:hypothetical protein
MLRGRKPHGFKFLPLSLGWHGPIPIAVRFPSLNGNAITLPAPMAVSNEQEWLARDLHW